jgi:hypothetical protein
MHACIEDLTVPKLGFGRVRQKRYRHKGSVLGRGKSQSATRCDGFSWGIRSRKGGFGLRKEAPGDGRDPQVFSFIFLIHITG